MSQTRRVLSAQIAHETNTFSIVPTTLDDYRKRLFLLGAEIAPALGATRMEIAGHLAAAKRYGWTLVQPIAASATPSGKVTAECWAELQRLLYAACETRPLDGVILALHGAMVTETDEDAEGALLEGLRKRLGDTIPIAVTLDLHANVTERMGRLANIMLPYRTYPHIDQYETAVRAADLLQAAMDGKIRPKVAHLQGPLLDGCNHGRTQGGVMSDLLARAAGMETQTPGLLSVDVCAGFSRSDIAEVGPSVQVTYDASHNAAETAACQAAASLYDEMVRFRLQRQPGFRRLWRRRPPAGGAAEGQRQGRAARGPRRSRSRRPLSCRGSRGQPRHRCRRQARSRELRTAAHADRTRRRAVGRCLRLRGTDECRSAHDARPLRPARGGRHLDRPVDQHAANL
jgi:microcystin degradation protein MlrC